MRGIVPILLRRAFAALPDAVTASVFLTLWITPLAFGAHGVRNGMLVMLVEFILIHATVFVPLALVALVARFDSFGKGVAVAAALVAVYLLFLAALSAGFHAWWPCVAFTWLLLGKFGLPMLEANAASDDDGSQGAVWLVSVLAYLFGAFATTLIPLPEFGFAAIEHSVLDLPVRSEGIWIDEPYRVMAFGAFYFGLLAWTKWRLAAPAGKPRAVRRVR